MFLFILGILTLLAGIIGGIVLMCNDYKAYGGGAIAGGLVLGILCVVLSCTTNIPTGHTGIVTVFGRVESTTLDAGLHGKAPWQSIVKMDNRVQKETVELNCFSSDLQEVSVKYTLNYQINKQTASEIYKTIGKKYEDVAVTPTVAESVKTVVAKFTAEALIANRTVLAAGVEEELGKALNAYNIELVSTAIEDMDFSDTFTNAVEAKQVAAQNKLKAETEQAQKTMEAQQAAERAKIEANAAAEIAKIQAQADMEVAKIAADTAEYAGRKDAATTLQGLASVNGWTVVSITDPEGNSYNQLYKPDKTLVTQAELEIGVKNYIEKLKNEKWDGKLPVYMMGTDSTVTVVTP